MELGLPLYCLIYVLKHPYKRMFYNTLRTQLSVPSYNGKCEGGSSHYRKQHVKENIFLGPTRIAWVKILPSHVI
jgi:hypothetical protein